MGTARMARPTYEQLEARVNQLQVEDTQLLSQVPRLEARIAQLERLLEQATGTAARFPHRVKKFLQDSLALRDRRDAGRISDHGLAVARGRLEKRLDRLLNARSKHAGNPTHPNHPPIPVAPCVAWAAKDRKSLRLSSYRRNPIASPTWLHSTDEGFPALRSTFS